MTIIQLEYLSAVVKHGSFANAARQLHVTQPTLSMQIKKLEEELEILLLDRSQSPIELTSIGRVVLDHAHAMIRQRDILLEQIAQTKDELKGEVRIGIIPTLSPYLLPLFITEFMKNNPELHLHVEELMTDQIISELDQENLDFGILVTPLHEKFIDEYPLFYELFVVYLNENHPLYEQKQVSYADLKTDQLWLLQEGHCFRNQMMNICEPNNNVKSIPMTFESGSLETIKRLVDQKYGYTLLPELATLSMSEDEYQHVRHFQNPQPVREVSLVTRKNFIKQRLLKRLQESILKSVPKILKNTDRGNVIEID